MSDRFDERLLRYIEGGMSGEERQELEREIAGSASLAAEVEEARRGLEALRLLGGTEVAAAPPLAQGAWESLRSTGDVPPTSAAPSRPRGDTRPAASPGLRRAAVIAALFLLPASGWFARGWLAPPGPADGGLPVPGVATPAVPAVEMQQYLLLFTGSWPDMETLTAPERAERQQAYMAWVGWLEEEGRFVAGSELGGDPGIFMASTGMGVTEFQPDLPPEEIVVGFVYFRAESPEEARRIAAECPHVRYGSGVLLKGADGMAM